MRKIKFRGYDTDDKVWRYGSYFCKEDTTLSPIYNSKEQWEKDKKENEHHLIIWNGFSDWNLPKPHYQSEVDGETVGQYIGLHDKNGKEIYEGDICLASCKFFNMQNQKSKVIFKDGCFCFQYGCTDDYVKTFNAWNSNSIEVIGNIYENPELLEVNTR